MSKKDYSIHNIYYPDGDFTITKIKLKNENEYIVGVQGSYR